MDRKWDIYANIEYIYYHIKHNFNPFVIDPALLNFNFSNGFWGGWHQQGS